MIESKTMLIAAVVAMMAAGVSGAEPKEGETVHLQDRDVFVHGPNYDKGKIAPYTLEDPLTFLDGRKVTKENWAARRKEILGIFAREMYGAEPPPPESLVTELVDEKTTVAGFGIRRRYKMYFKADRTGPCINWIVWIPRHVRKPVPVILFLNYRGNHELVPDEDVEVTDAWLMMSWPAKFGIRDHRANPKNRGLQQSPNSIEAFPLAGILARGYAVMSACYAEVSRDTASFAPDENAYDRVFTLWGPRDPKRTDNTTALGAWGWALSRGLDLAGRIPEIDTRRSVVTGYSRLGKAALIAAARDERFAVCVPNQTGGGGAPLAKRNYGENVSTENREFPHWYCPAYAKYASDPAKLLTFDQHLFLACIAPRALLVEGYDEKWFDTEGEYLAVKAASPVWELLTGSGMPEVAWPDDYDTSAIGSRLGYVRRTEGHGISAYDWMWMMDFADRVLERGCDAGRVSTSAYSVAILGDTHYDAEPESVYHSNYDESNRWAKIQHAEFRRNGEMWRGRCRDLVAASAHLAREKPTDFVLQLGDIIQGDCDDVPTHQKMLDDCIRILRAPYPKDLPFLTVMGNHDIRGKGARQAYFDFAESFLSRQLGQPVKYPVFSFLWKDDLWVFCDFEMEDLSPLLAAISAQPDVRHTFVVTHGPFTPSEGRFPVWRLAGRGVCDALRPKLYELLSCRHAIVLSGHTHETAWFRHENEFGGFAEFTANSVWKASELATAEPVCEGVAAYGKSAAATLTDERKAEFEAAAKEFRPGLKDYYLCMGAGHARMNVSATGVTIDYYPGATNVPARTFRMK